MKKVIIIHAWESSPKEHWYLEEKVLLEKMGYKVMVPDFPGGRWPKLTEWLKVMEGLDIDENTVLVGHSLGPAAIFRYLEKSKKKVDKVICIAGFVRVLGYEETRNFVDESFDWDLIKELTKEVVSIAQKEDPYVPVEISKEITDRTGGKFILVEGNNHFDTMDLDLINKKI